MIRQFREKIQSLPTGVRLLSMFIAGTAINTVLFGITFGIYVFFGLRLKVGYLIRQQVLTVV